MEASTRDAVTTLASDRAGTSARATGVTSAATSPLRPTTGPNGFTFPAIWSFPPFFT